MSGCFFLKHGVDKCVRGHRHTPVGMYDQTRMSGSIPVEHYSNQNKSEAAVAIDDDLRNQDGSRSFELLNKITTKFDGYSSFNQLGSKADIRHRPLISHVSCVKTRF